MRSAKFRKISLKPFHDETDEEVPAQKPPPRCRLGFTPSVPKHLAPCVKLFQIFLVLLVITSLTAVASVVGDKSTHILIVSLSFRGHVVPLTRLAAELVSRGHRVSFAIQEDGREHVSGTGANFISLGRHHMSLDEKTLKLKQISYDTSFFRGLLTLLNDVYVPYSVSMFPPLAAAVKRENPDLMIVDVGALAGIDVAHMFNIPYVINNPSNLFAVSMGSVGASAYTNSYIRPPQYVPARGSGFSQNMTLWERCLSLMYPRLLAVALTPSFMELNRLRRDRGLPLYITHDDIFRKSVVLVNTAFGLECPQPLPPLVKMTGPLMPSNRLAADFPIPSSLSSWLDQQSRSNRAPSASSTCVVASLFGSGSMSYLEQSAMLNLVKALADTRFRVIFSMRSDQRAKIGSVPSNFRVLSNFPQLPVLAHQAVRAVVSPCGMASAQEALYYGKPLLCIPLLGDQVDVAARVADSGAGLVVTKSLLYSTSTRLNSAAVARLKHDMLQLCRNNTYRAAATRVGNILRASGGSPAAADVVEGVLETGVDHLVSAAEQELAWHELQQLDLFLLVVACVCMLVLALRTCWAVVSWLWFWVINRYVLSWMESPLYDDKQLQVLMRNLEKLEALRDPVTTLDTTGESKNTTLHPEAANTPTDETTT